MHASARQQYWRVCAFPSLRFHHRMYASTLIIVKLYEEVKLTFAHLFSIQYNVAGWVPTGSYRNMQRSTSANRGRSAFVTKKSDFSHDGLPSGHCESVPERRKDVDSIRMTFTCFFLKDTETDGKDSVSQIIWVKYQKTM